MKIRTKLYLNNLSWICFLAVLVFLLTMAKTSIDESLREANLSDRIMIDASDMSTITYDYLLNPGERARMQWESKHASLNRLLNEAKLDGAEKGVLERMRRNHAEAALLFHELVSNFGDRANARRIPVSVEANRERLTAGLIARSRMIFSDASRLTRRITSHISETLAAYLSAIYIALGIMTSLAIAISFLISGEIAESIDRLRKGAESLARGDLAYNVPVLGNDEISDLSRDFNDMAVKLRSSREELQKEILKKEKARGEVRKAYTELEERVIDRTREITMINEELVRSQNRLKSTIRDLESFTYSVSHDLRAPLRAIDGFTKILLKELDNRLDPESIRRLKVVRENTEKMNRLIEDLLNLSRLGRQALNPELLDMRKIFLEAWAELSQAEPDRPVRFEPGPLKEASGDRALITQVVLNLLSNALKYTRGRDPALIEVGSSDIGDSIVYSVRDNGAGFDMQYADKLYGVFQRLHPEHEYEGTGVGLAIVKRIITRHGGRVWAEGEVGKGAVFYFSLPK